MHFHLPRTGPELPPESAEADGSDDSTKEPAKPSADAIPDDYDLLESFYGESHGKVAAESLVGAARIGTGERDAAPKATSAGRPQPPRHPAKTPPPDDDLSQQHPAERHATQDERKHPRVDSAQCKIGSSPGAEMSAFLTGLGVSDPPPVQDSEAMLHLAGQLLRTMTEGLIAVMMARAQFKSELGLEVTIIRSRENNPFQFCVDADDALDRLLWRRGRGYLDPAAAVQKSFDDIQAHQIAMIAGIRAAVQEPLTRLGPLRLEKQFEQQSHLEKLLPMARKSKCWDLFVSTFEEIADDAADDFFRLFGGAFNRAYEAQIRRLSAARRQDPD